MAMRWIQYALWIVMGALGYLWCGGDEGAGRVLVMLNWGLVLLGIFAASLLLYLAFRCPRAIKSVERRSVPLSSGIAVAFSVFFAYQGHVALGAVTLVYVWLAWLSAVIGRRAAEIGRAMG